MEKWRLVDLEHVNPYINMAIEEAILIAVNKELAPNTVRFWRNLNAVVLGYSQKADLEINLEACRKYGIAIVRRFTGGGAVYHDYGNLNWNVVLKRSHVLVPKDTFKVYNVVAKAIIEGIRVLGIEATFKPPSTIQVDGKKVSGMAMYIKRNALLCHGTLLVSSNLNVLSEIFNVPNKSRRIISVEVTTLKSELNRGASILEVKRSIVKGFRELYKINLEKEDLKEEEEELTQRLCKKKYGRSSWNLAHETTEAPQG